MLQEIFSFIVDTVAGLLAGFLLLRFWMQVLRIRPPAQLAQPIFHLTDWIVLPLRRLISGVGGLDWASLIAAVLVAVLSIVLDVWVFQQVPVTVVLILALFRLIEWIIYGLIGFLIIEVILSWVNPYAPLAPFLRSLNEPILAPLRRVLPPLGGMDFSPLVALLVLQILLRVLREALPYVLSF